MAIYVIAGLLVVLFLFGAYRMMGAGASTEEDPRGVLAAVLDTTTKAAGALDSPPVSSDDDNGPHAIRRRLDGCAQALERIAAIPVDVALDQARTSLELAVDELSWSARMAEAPAYARDDSLREAGTALRTRGAANIARARSLLEASARS
jgi:hypothetical protein